MIGHPDERDVRRWRAADPEVMRADLDRSLSADTASPSSDAELITAVRGGTIRAYGLLYARHVQAARNLARQLAMTPVDADDLVSDAFAKVLAPLLGLTANGVSALAYRAREGPRKAYAQAHVARVTPPSPAVPQWPNWRPGPRTACPSAIRSRSRRTGTGARTAGP